MAKPGQGKVIRAAQNEMSKAESITVGYTPTASSTANVPTYQYATTKTPATYTSATTLTSVGNTT